MALIKSCARLRHSLSPLLPRTFNQHCSSDSLPEPLLQPDPNDTCQTPNLSPEETTLADKLHAAIKDHHRRNPSPNPNAAPPTPNLAIPDLSLDFSALSAAQTLSPAVARRVIEKCGAVRHGIPLFQSLAFFNWATSLDGFPPRRSPTMRCSTSPES
ncbi:hypothetical protein ACSQ67_026071 [Phaseolus vulgaris]